MHPDKPRCTRVAVPRRSRVAPADAIADFDSKVFGRGAPRRARRRVRATRGRIGGQFGVADALGTSFNTTNLIERV